MNLSKWAVLRECCAAGMARHTKKAQSVVFQAFGVARRCGDQEIRPEHVLLGIIASDKSLADRLSLPATDLVADAFNLKESDEPHSRPKLSPAARHVMSCAAEERERLGHVHTGTEHLLLGMIRAGGAAAELLQQYGISVERVHQVLYHQSRSSSWKVVKPAMA
jgi:ATP-dependent Clp protease ATP-binding subunit ClpC